MSVPPEVMQKLMAGGGGAAPGGGAPPPSAPASAPGGQPPAASPMAKPQAKKGLETAALNNVRIAQKMLLQAVSNLHPESEEYKKVLKVLNQLAEISPKQDTSDLVPAEVLQMVSRLPQMGGGTEVQQQLQKMMAGGCGGQKPPAAPMAA